MSQNKLSQHSTCIVKQQVPLLDLKKSKGREHLLSIMLCEFKQYIESPGRMHT